MIFIRPHSHHIPKRNILFAALILLLLSFLTSTYFRINPSVGNEVKKLQHHITKQQEDFQSFLEDSELMRNVIQENESIREFKQVADKKYGIFLYAETITGQLELLFWNTHKIPPPQVDPSLPDGEYVRHTATGYYLQVKKKVTIPGISSNIVTYAMIPIMYQYKVPSSYLVNHFAHDKEAIKKIFVSDLKTPHIIYSANKKPLLYIGQKTHLSIAVADPLTLTLRITSLLLLLLYAHFLAGSIVRKRGALKGTFFILAVLVFLRCIIEFLPEVLFLKQFELFSPQVYGTDWLNKSLGHLLINSVIFCWIVVFAWFNLGPIKRLPSWLTGIWIPVAGVVALFFLIISTFRMADVVRSLIADSKISFNVTEFFSLHIYTVVGFIVLAILSLAYYYFTRLLFRFIFPAFEGRQVFIYFIIALVGLVYLSFQSGNAIVLFHIPVLIWLVVYTLLVSQEQFIINRFKITMAGVLFWIFVFSISLSAVILQENQKKEWTVRKGIAEKHDEITDPSQEKPLSIALTFLDNDFLSSNFNRFTSLGTNRYLRDSIMNANSLAFRSAYNTRIYLFDSLNRGIYNEDPRSFEELNNILTIQSKQTGIPDLYYHETSFDNLTYITKREIKDTSAYLGALFIVSTLKKYNSDAIYPELFRNIRHTDVQDLPSYSYAIYSKNLLTSASNKYPFRTRLLYNEIPKREFERRINGDFDELWYKASSQKVVVVAKKRDTFLESITLFSYLFCAFLFMVAVLQIIALLLKPSSEWRLSNLFSELSIRSQVHGIIIFISILSFLIIGAATISFFIDRYNRNNVDKLSRTSGIMVKEMEKRLLKYNSFDDILRVNDSAVNQELQTLIAEVAEIHNVDVNVYKTDGNLVVSSRPDVYKEGILSTKIHPQAYYHLDRLRQVQHVQEETMSSLKYLSIYAAVRDKSGQVYAYLNIPYFLSQIDLNQEISNFLVTIINLNAFIFLIAGVIALFITNRITRSFSVIGDKMKAITLGKANEEIEWNRRDEIGELVTQYNKMVRQLEESASALAKSEREGAWREMARQVAHEIKNPLTPMKLSIQYLQRAIQNNHDNVKELTSRVASTLVEQIDHLSKIAADFSRFANIGNQNIEDFDVHLVLASLVDLYKANPKVQIDWIREEGEIILRADRTHINRLFTNLLTNAVDACSENDLCFIEIKEELADEFVLIKISDNGEGISEEMKSKIFVPNFTTKSSGTGLGLAMCKGIVEQIGGDIWFETEAGKGTTFFVKLPVVLS